MIPASLASFDALALSLAHFVLAAAVTAHALLHKRDPGSAVAWIGLAWLSPVVGSVLYALLGINRVRRRAQSLRPRPLRPEPPGSEPHGRRADHLAALEDAGRHISRRTIARGNAVQMFENGDGAYPPMIAAIEAAQQSIALSSYIFRADTAGNPFIDALVRAHRRGVAVRVLIDGFGGGYLRSPTYRALRGAGVPVARFLHSALPWRMPFLNLRTHRKVLTIDGRTAFTGGLNIGAENLLASGPRHPVRDTHWCFRGPVVAQIGEAFAEQWQFETGETLAGEPWFPRCLPAGETPARVVTSGPDQDMQKIEMLILEAIGCARQRIEVMTPYFLPDDRIVTALVLAAMRGVEVDIVIPRRSNHWVVDWATRAHVHPLVAAGCRIWMHAPPFDHSKLMAVDGAWGFVGSTNWDIRSFRLNFEVNVEVYDLQVVRCIEEKMRSNRGTCLSAADLDGRSLPVCLRDGAARLLLPYL